MALRKKYSKQKSSSLFFGLVLMVAGLGAGVILVSQPQLLDQKAQAIGYSCTKNSCGTSCTSQKGFCTGTKPNCKCVIHGQKTEIQDLPSDFSCSGWCNLRASQTEWQDFVGDIPVKFTSGSCIGVGTDDNASNKEIMTEYKGEYLGYQNKCDGRRWANCRTILHDLGNFDCGYDTRRLEQTYCKCKLYY